MPTQATTPLRSTFGDCTFHCFSFGPHEEDNVLVADCLDRVVADEHPLVRVQSACYTAEIFRSTDCDCHAQLATSLTRIHREGGAVIYMLCDGRGAGLLTKVRGLSLGHRFGTDTHDAYQELGVPMDPRDYSKEIAVAESLGLSKLRLMSNNPRKLAAFAAAFEITREKLIIAGTDESLPYLRTKSEKMGHLMNYE